MPPKQPLFARFRPRSAVVPERPEARRLVALLQVGDIVFIRANSLPFRKVASATLSWTNHVGIVIETGGAEPLVAESRFPRSVLTPLSAFLARSAEGRVEISRLRVPLSLEQRARIPLAARRRLGVFYDTGFNLQSRRQFCSRYVMEVLEEAAGVQLGQRETFAMLLAQNPEAGLGFWRCWYLGRIPWQRETVTPASQQRSPLLEPVFDGRVALPRRRLKHMPFRRQASRV